MRQAAEAQKMNTTKIAVNTDRFGELEVEAEKIIILKNPLLGFPKLYRFMLLPHKGNSPFLWLQSLENPALAFVVVHPSTLGISYRPSLDERVRHELELAADENPDLLLILTIPRGRPEAMTANLLGPLAINVRKRLGLQAVLDPRQYDAAWPILAKEEACEGSN